MTPEELRKQLHEALEGARHVAAEYVGKPIVLTLEGLGYRIVPAGLVNSLEKRLDLLLTLATTVRLYVDAEDDDRVSEWDAMVAALAAAETGSEGT